MHELRPAGRRDRRPYSNPELLGLCRHDRRRIARNPTDRIVADEGSTDPVTDSYPRLKYTPQPEDYHSWPRDAKLSYLTEQYDRIQIAAAIRREIGILNRLGKQRLNSKEIAAISLDTGIQL